RAGARARRTGRRTDGRRTRPGRRYRKPTSRAGALRRTRRCRRGRSAAACTRRIGIRSSETPVCWRAAGGLRDTGTMSGLAFTLLAVMLVGPVPEMLARATWPLRAPRAAMVLWQAIAVAAVLSAFSAGIAIASRLFVPGADG